MSITKIKVPEQKYKNGAFVITMPRPLAHDWTEGKLFTFYNEQDQLLGVAELLARVEYISSRFISYMDSNCSPAEHWSMLERKYPGNLDFFACLFQAKAGLLPNTTLFDKPQIQL